MIAPLIDKLDHLSFSWLESLNLSQSETGAALFEDSAESWMGLLIGGVNAKGRSNRG